ncbi:MAG: toll/interleukin-1 receptor domain-containing protein, partial [Lachnospiraceae bacterium]
MIIELDIADGDDRDYYFLSYDHEDAERVSEIIQKLAWSGVSIWYDKGLLPGDEIRTILAEKIKNSKAVIMFVTNTIWAKENSFVQQEYDVAREIYRKRIIIVLLDKINFDSIPAHKAFWTSQIKNMLCIKGYDGESPMEVTEEILKAA